MLNVEQLEQRDAPAVFHFNYQSDFYNARSQEVLEAAGRYLGNQLKTTDIYIDALAMPLGNAVARAGPYFSDGQYRGRIIFDPTLLYSYSYTNNQSEGYHFFTIALHELEHILGIGTVPGWEIGSMNRGVPISNDKAHFARGVQAVGSESIAGYGPFKLTDIDLNALNDLGWEVKREAQLPYYFLSISFPSQPVQLYVVYQGYPFLLFTTGNFHVIVQDYNYDGIWDYRFISKEVVGFDVTYSGDGSLLDNLTYSYKLDSYYSYKLALTN